MKSHVKFLCAAYVLAACVPAFGQDYDDVAETRSRNKKFDCLTVRRHFSDCGDAVIAGLLTANGGVIVNGTQTVNGNQIVNGAQSVTGNFAVGGNLIATGTVIGTIAGGTIVGNETVTGTLTVDGLTTLNDGLDVTAGAATFADGLTVTAGATTIGGTASIAGLLSLTTPNILDYGSFYSSQAVTALTGVTLTPGVTSSNYVALAPGAGVTVRAAGTYLVLYYVLGAADAAWALEVQGTLVPGSQINNVTPETPATGFAVVTVPALDNTISIVAVNAAGNDTGTPVGAGNTVLLTLVRVQ